MVTEQGLFFFDFDRMSMTPYKKSFEEFNYGNKKFTLIVECDDSTFVIATIETPHFVKLNRDSAASKVIIDQAQKSNEHGYTDL